MHHAFEETKHFLVRRQLAPVQPPVRCPGYKDCCCRIVCSGIHPGSEHWVPFERNSKQQKFLICFRRNSSRSRSPFVPFVATVPTVVFVAPSLIIVDHSSVRLRS